MNLRLFQQLQERVEELKQRAERSKGAVAELMKELRKEFKVGTMEEAAKLLADMEKKGRKQEAEADAALEAFEVKWRGKLE